MYNLSLGRAKLDPECNRGFWRIPESYYTKVGGEVLQEGSLPLPYLFVRSVSVSGGGGPSYHWCTHLGGPVAS